MIKQSFRYRPPTASAAFSLLEMAVVLAIIGLIAGGVLVASSYTRTTQLTSLVNEAKFYLGAVQQFERNYGGAMPGDMANATDYWGTAADCAVIASGTCNGNGSTAIDSSAEYFLAFHHLAKAGLITGNYTGVAGSGGANHGITGTNLPNLSVDNVSGWFATPSATGDISGNAAYYDGFYGTPFYVARETANALPSTGFMKPMEAFELDSKYDNGQPDSGWIRTYKNYAACVTGTAYSTTSTDPQACPLIFSRP